MANTYTFHGPGERWVVEDATAEDLMNLNRENSDHLHEALNTIMDTDAADGIVTGTVSGPYTGTIDMRFSAGLKFSNATANKAATMFWRDSDQWLVLKKAAATVTPPTPSDEDDYDVVISEMEDIDPVGPSF
jgi:hypothetical protein